MPPGYSRKAMFSGGRVQQEREINHRSRSPAMIQRERFHSAVRCQKRRKGRRDKQDKESDTHSSSSEKGRANCQFARFSRKSALHSRRDSRSFSASQRALKAPGKM